MGLCAYISEGSTAEHCVGDWIQLATASAETQAAPASLPAWFPVYWGKWAMLRVEFNRINHVLKLNIVMEQGTERTTLPLL